MVIRGFPTEERYGLGNQLRRAMNSVILNIAEGSYRKTDKDFAHFLNQAAASVYECVSCLDLAFDSKYINDSLRHELTLKFEEIAKPITGLSKTLH